MRIPPSGRAEPAAFGLVAAAGDFAASADAHIRARKQPPRQVYRAYASGGEQTV